MKQITIEDIKKIYIPPKDSHKGQNGKLLIIGGSHLFHSASLWGLKVASRIVDLVHFSSVLENNAIVQKLKEEFRDGIVVPRAEVESYIEEDDCVLIGPGMVRADEKIFNFQFSIFNLENILKIEDEGAQTYYLTKYLLGKYPKKKWVIDAGALQMMEPEWTPKDAILTPHRGEFERLINKIRNPNIEIRNNPPAGGQKSKNNFSEISLEDQVKLFAREFNCTVLLKGEKDIVCTGKCEGNVCLPTECRLIEGGNQGMTKGGTGDVLAGLVAGLYCKNEAFLAAAAASFINKKAGEDLAKKMGLWFNASDLADQIPQTMKELLL